MLENLRQGDLNRLEALCLLHRTDIDVSVLARHLWFSPRGNEPRFPFLFGKFANQSEEIFYSLLSSLDVHD